MKSRGIGAVVLTLATLLLVACGGDDDKAATGDKAPAQAQAPAVKGAKVIDPQSMENATGNVTLCTGKDTAGEKTQGLKEFNAQFGGQGLKAKMLEFPASGDEQRNQFAQRQDAKSGECDVYVADVIDTAEFASQNWLYDLTPYVQKRSAEFVPSTFATVKYAGKLWGVPRSAAAGFLYYRTDQVKTPPSTWQAVYQDAKANSGIVFQGASYEGLTCDFLELAYSAGGTVLSADGKKSTIDSPQNLKALQFMVDGVKNGTAPRGVVTYMEEEARRYWESGKATFMRNWPYAYALGQAKGSKVAGKFKVLPFPTFEGGGKAGILGGDNLVISTYSKNPGGALKLIDFMTSAEIEKQNAAKFSFPPSLNATFDEPEVKKALPFAAELKQAVTQAKARPVSPVYRQISQAIYKNVNAALAGNVSPQDALKTTQSQMDKALATF
jgi:multiple sugar transport system substrate-binding protein